MYVLAGGLCGSNMETWVLTRKAMHGLVTPNVCVSTERQCP